jgi:hypothetical protein
MTFLLNLYALIRLIFLDSYPFVKITISSKVKFESGIFRGAASQYLALPARPPVLQLALFTHETSTEASVAPGFMGQVYTCIMNVYKCTGVKMYNCSKQSVCDACLHSASSTTCVVLVVSKLQLISLLQMQIAPSGVRAAAQHSGHY